MLLALIACAPADSADDGDTKPTGETTPVDHPWGTVDTAEVAPFSRSILYTGAWVDLAAGTGTLLLATTHTESFPLVADCVLEVPATLTPMTGGAACPECTFTFEATASGAATRYGTRCGSFTDTFDLTDASLDGTTRSSGYAPSYYQYNTMQTFTGVIFIGYTGGSFLWVPSIYTTPAGEQMGGYQATTAAESFWFHKYGSNASYTYGY